MVLLAASAVTACGGSSKPKALDTTTSSTSTTAVSTSTAVTSSPVGSTSTTAAARAATTSTSARPVATTATPTSTTAVPRTTVPPAPPAGAAILVKGFAFNPPTLNIAKGTTVTVTNQDSTTHTWTADDGSWTNPLPPAGTASRRFDTAGTFTYHCAIHTSMTGKVVVS